MSLARLDIHQVRNIAAARLDLSQRFNVFFGPNGSGKTSLLESIYLLGSGHSFRSRELLTLVSYDAPNLTVFGEMDTGDSVSIQKNKQGTVVRLNKATCQRSSDLARYLPCQVFYQDIFEIMDAGPAVRRSLLDWGLFHMEPDYHTIWKDYKRVLKQRNALLRERVTRRQCAPWDEQLVSLSEMLDEFRAAYFTIWADAFEVILSKLTSLSCRIIYDKGWDKKNKGITLQQILDEQFELDIQRQYTHSGAHQADILFETTGHKAKKTLSRGQQKIILIALKLAQAKLLPGICTYLFDDITAELDRAHAGRFFKVLETIEGQFFFTVIEPNLFIELFEGNNITFFQLNAGNVSRETLEDMHSVFNQ
ncbi:MAG: DNA replication/repair protein RecF [Legionellaceae bacterium]|nr:DNA replication/repair protein RecF [Legionellaceae bacterium]